jgi:hypothetical protein
MAIAWVTACVRLLTSSLRNIAATCFFVVPEPIRRLCEIAELDAPPANCCNTSNSRGVSDLDFGILSPARQSEPPSKFRIRMTESFQDLERTVGEISPHFARMRRGTLSTLSAWNKGNADVALIPHLEQFATWSWVPPRMPPALWGARV